MQKIKVLNKSLHLSREPGDPQKICIKGTFGYTDEKRAKYLVAMGDAEYPEDDIAEPAAPDAPPAANPTPPATGSQPTPDPAPAAPEAPAAGGSDADGAGEDTSGLA